MVQQDNKHILAIWEKAVDTQMHFNEMSVKSRQLGLTFVAAALGVSAVLLSREEDFSYTLEIAGWIFSVHVSVLLVLVAMLGVYAVRTLDLGVYHKMLRGAVTFGEDLEENYIKQNFFELEMGMTQAISHFSRHSDASVTKSNENGRYQYGGGNEISAFQKISSFYNVVLIFLLLSAIVLFLLSAKLHPQNSVGIETNAEVPPAIVELRTQQAT